MTSAKPTTQTKAPVGAPPKKKDDEFKLLANIANAPAVVPNNIKKDRRWKDLNFKVEDDFGRVFKATAAAHGLSMKELLEQCFSAWTAKNKGA